MISATCSRDATVAGKRLRFGPIDCRIQAEGGTAEVACAEAERAFPDILPALCAELEMLRTPLPSPPPRGSVARAMHAACAPYAELFITPMAAVAGAVADHLIRMMTAGRTLRRAFVNNGGDIAVHLAPGERMRIGMVTDLAAPTLDGMLVLDRSCGVATSGRACKGRGGRSFSLGIADAVTVIARDAATADAAATVIANAVDLPGHQGVVRRPACEIDPESDLGTRMITWDVGRLAADEIEAALDAGRRVADGLRAARLIDGAALALRGHLKLCGEAQQALGATPG